MLTVILMAPLASKRASARACTRVVCAVRCAIEEACLGRPNLARSLGAENSETKVLEPRLLARDGHTHPRVAALTDRVALTLTATTFPATWVQYGGVRASTAHVFATCAMAAQRGSAWPPRSAAWQRRRSSDAATTRLVGLPGGRRTASGPEEAEDEGV